MIEWRTVFHDFLENSVLRRVYFTRYRWITWVVAALIAIAIGVASGWIIAEIHVLAVAALLAGIIFAIWGITDINLVYVGIIAVICLLPFGSLPFSIGFTPTFLDLTLLALFGVWALPYLLGYEQRFTATRVGGYVAAFLFLAIVAFVAGLKNGALTSYSLRHFVEILLSVSLFFVVVNTVSDEKRLTVIVRWLILGASAAAFLGIVLYFLPDQLTVNILSALGRFGYPVGSGVLRYIRDDPSELQRATSTSVDPNVLGSLLSLAITIAVPQLFTKRAIFPKWLLLGLLGVMALCLGLTVSRGSMLAVGVAIFVLAILRYRVVLPWLIIGAILLLVLPWTQELIVHFVQGFALQDLSTQMRLGEYKDALILIQRYPFLGVGFTGAPDLDIYVAVANVYMIIAAQMGLVGLLAFLSLMVAILLRFWRNRKVIIRQSALEPLWYGLNAAIIAGLVSGVFDHFFFSLDFHHSVTVFWLIVGLATVSTEMLAGRTRVD